MRGTTFYLFFKDCFFIHAGENASSPERERSNLYRAWSNSNSLPSVLQPAGCWASPVSMKLPALHPACTRGCAHLSMFNCMLKQVWSVACFPSPEVGTLLSWNEHIRLTSSHWTTTVGQALSWVAGTCCKYCLQPAPRGSQGPPWHLADTWAFS